MSRFEVLLAELGVPIDAELFELARVHRSYSYEQGAIPTNERLEFLGDAVLGVVVTDFLYRTFPDHSEGRLAKLRAAVVNAHSLADVARSLDIGPLLRLGRGEVLSAGHDKTSILADAFEALLGAVYLSAGLDETSRLIHHLFDPLILHADALGAGLDWKTSLQEVCAEQGYVAPTYAIEEEGPDHDKRFTARAIVNGVAYPPGYGRSKKQAEQEAAEYAFTTVRRELDAAMATAAQS